MNILRKQLVAMCTITHLFGSFSMAHAQEEKSAPTTQMPVIYTDKKNTAKACAKHLVLALAQSAGALAAYTHYINFFQTTHYTFDLKYFLIWSENFLENRAHGDMSEKEINQAMKIMGDEALALSYPCAGAALSGVICLTLGWKSVKNLGRSLRDLYQLTR